LGEHRLCKAGVVGSIPIVSIVHPTSFAKGMMPWVPP
jgi:hypothetical protein